MLRLFEGSPLPNERGIRSKIKTPDEYLESYSKFSIKIITMILHYACSKALLFLVNEE